MSFTAKTRDVAVCTIAALAFLLLLAPSAPLGRELAACEVGAARDILLGNFILPHYRPQTGMMIQTPPLFWWSAALSTKLLGWNEFALRLPSLVSAALTCAIVFAWLYDSAGRRAAFWSAAVLISCHYFLDAARQARMDAMFAMLIAAASTSLYWAFAAEADRRTRARLIAPAVTIGLACLVKGPAGVILPALTLVAYALARGKIAQLLEHRLLAAFATAVAIGGAWYVAGTIAGGMAFVRWQIVQGLIGRFIGTDRPALCPNPFYYFVPVVLGGFIPWTLYLPALAAWTVKRRGALSDPMVFSLCWFAVTFVFFSASRGRCFIYMLPGFPPLAAATGLAIAGFCDKADSALRRVFAAGSGAAAAGAIAIVAAGCGIYLFGMPRHLPIRLHPTDLQFLELFVKAVSKPGPIVVAWMLVSAFGIVLLVRGLRAGIGSQASGALVIAASGSLFWFNAINPGFAERHSLRDFSRAIQSAVPSSAQIDYIDSDNDCDLDFYTDYSATPIDAFNCGLARRNERLFLVARKDRLDRLGDSARACLKPVAESRAVDRHGSRLLCEVKPP